MTSAALPNNETRKPLRSRFSARRGSAADRALVAHNENEKVKLMTNQEKWIAFCEQNDPEISIYDKPFWLDAVCEGRENWDVFLVEKPDGEIEAALPFCKKKRMGFHYITMPKLTQRNGIWMKKVDNEKDEKRTSRENKLYQMLIDQIEGTGADFYHQCFSPDVMNWQPFYWMGYRQKTLYTFCIDYPNNMAEAEKHFSKTTVRNLKRASQNGTVVELEDTRIFHQVNTMTYARQGMDNPISFALLDRLYKACKERNAVLMLGVKDENGIISSVALFVYDSNTVYALMCGTDPKKRGSNFQTMLTYEGIKFACDTGRRFDFEGSMMEGVVINILGFGAKMHPYYSIRKIFVKMPIVSQYLKYKLYT